MSYPLFETNLNIFCLTSAKTPHHACLWFPFSSLKFPWVLLLSLAANWGSPSPCAKKILVLGIIVCWLKPSKFNKQSQKQKKIPINVGFFLIQYDFQSYSIPRRLPNRRMTRCCSAAPWHDPRSGDPLPADGRNGMEKSDEKTRNPRDLMGFIVI
jgi:hypothetical protein